MPHRFVARLEIKEDGKYVFTYSGSYWDMDVLSAYSSSPPGAAMPNPDDVNQASLIEEKVSRMLQVLSLEPRLVSYEHMGAGLFNVLYRQAGDIHDTSLLLVNEFAVLFSLKKSNDGQYADFSFSAVPVQVERGMQMPMPGPAMNLDATIEIFSELPVTTTHASPQKSADGRTLVWHFTSWGQNTEKPYARFLLQKGR